MDGVTWAAVADSTFFVPAADWRDDYSIENIYSIAWGGNKFVAGGGSGRMAYSADGITWIAVANSTFGKGSYNDINSIAWGSNKFVAVGYNGEMAYSADGIIWTAVANSTFGSDFSNNRIFGVVWGNNKFVACGQRGKMAYSADGVTWTAVANSSFGTGSFDNITDIAWDGNKFVAVGNSGKMAFSTDGISWTAVADSTFGYSSISSIAWGGNKFVAVGDDGKAAYSSDGITWVAIVDSKFDTSYINGIAWGGNKFVAVGRDGKIAYSDGNENPGQGGNEPLVCNGDDGCDKCRVIEPEPVFNVTFPYIDNPSQQPSSVFTNAISTAIYGTNGLLQQSQAVDTMYDQWQPANQTQTTLKSNMQGKQAMIQNGYKKNTVNNILNNIDVIAWVRSALSAASSNPALFDAQMQAFRLATQANKSITALTASEQTNLQNALNSIVALGGPQIEQQYGAYDATAQTLKGELKKLMEDCGTPHMNESSLRQLEDFDNFYKWINDMPSSVLNRTIPSGTTQTSNNILLGSEMER